MVKTTSEHGRRILTPDQHLRVFVSAAMPALRFEREAVARAIESLRLTPVMVDAGARPHAAPDVYRSYVKQSDIFVGIYGDGESGERDRSALLEEYDLARGLPRLIYAKVDAAGSPARNPVLEQITSDGDLSYRVFVTATELEDLLANDLAMLLTERFADPATPAGATPARPSLPVTPTSFVGRQRQVDQVLALLRDPAVRMVTLTGPGGVGKTRLALEVGKQTSEDFPDGAVIVWLDALGDPSFLMQALGAELHVKETAEYDILAALENRLRGLRMLIVLDNFEHLMAAAPQLADLVAVPTASKFLVTSRELLHIRGEHAVPLEPLQLPTGGDVPPERSEAVALFVARAQAVSPHFRLTPDNTPAVVGIVRRLEGVPLALELAAAQTRLLPPAALLRRLDSPLDLPGAGARDLPARQQTLRDTIEWSYRLLDPAEQEALERFSVFAVGATIDAALDVVGEVAGRDPLELLESLLRKSLLRRTEDADGEVHLSLLAAIRLFAGAKLDERGTRPEIRERHGAYYRRFVARAAASVHSADQAAQLAAVDSALENVAAALEWYVESANADAALNMANDLRWYWILRGHLSAADRWIERLLALPGGDTVIRAQAQTTAGMIAMEIGDRRRARTLFESAVSALEGTDDVDGLAWAQSGLGAALHASGSFAKAAALQERALEVFRSNEDLVGQCTANTRIAVLALSKGDYESAEERFQGSLAVRRKIRDPWGTSYVLTALASVRLLADDYDQASAYFSEALDLVRSIDHRDGIARVLDGLGVIAAARGSWDDAITKFDEAVRLYSDVGNRGGMALAMAHMARAEIEVRSAGAAAEHAIAAYGIAQETGESAALATTIETLGAALACSPASAGMAAELFGIAEGVRTRHRIRIPPGNPLGPGTCRVRAESELQPDAFEERFSRGLASPAEGIPPVVAAAQDALLDAVAPSGTDG